MKKKPLTTAEDQLFAAAPPVVQKVMKHARQLRRDFDRKVWWEKHGKKDPQ